MIKATQVTIPKLSQEYNFCQYLEKLRIFIRWNTDMEFAIYKFDNLFNQQEYRISLKHLGIHISNLQFSQRNEAGFLFGSGGNKKLFLIFVLDIQQQELGKCKQIQMDDVEKYDWVGAPNSTQIYILQQQSLRVIEFSSLPEVEEYEFATNVESFEILYLEQCQLLKLTSNCTDEYYLLPLTKNAQPVNYNPNNRNTILLRENGTQHHIISKISQVYFLNEERITVGHYFPSVDDQRLYFSERFGIMYDSQYWVKLFQIKAKSKILRKVQNIFYVHQFILPYIICKSYCNTQIIYDCMTGQILEMDLPKFNCLKSKCFRIQMDLPNQKLVYLIEKS